MFYDASLKKRAEFPFISPLSLSVSPAGSRIAVLQGRLTVHDGTTGEKILQTEVKPAVALRGRLECHSQEEGWLAVNNHEGEDPNLVMFGWSDLKTRTALRSQLPKARRIAVDDNSGLIVLGDGKRLELIEPDPERTSRIVELPAKGSIVSLSTGGARAYAGTSVGEIAAVDLKQGGVLWSHQMAEKTTVKLGASASGNVLCTAQERKTGATYEIALAAFAVEKEKLAEISRTMVRSIRRVNDICIIEASGVAVIAADGLAAWTFR
ncbi:MAG: hypothetical protein GF355_16665 [Candidatus Eisenbacteria bacterium]|nr:hypothetical protein [Candidatus Eisenbacteria bacterium]